MSLRLRLCLGLGAVLVSVLVVLTTLIVRETRRDLLDTTREQLDSAVFRRVTNPRAGSGQQDRPVDPRGVRTAHLVYGGDDARLVADPSGTPDAPDPLPVLDRTQLAQIRAGAAVTTGAEQGSLEYLVVGAMRADGRLEIEAAPLDQVEATVAGLRRRLAIGSALLLVLGSGAVVLVVRRGLAGLDDLAEVAAAVAAGDDTRRPDPSSGPTEVRRVAAALDHMLDAQTTALRRREESETKLRRFVADASHELQTPLTSVLGWVQLQRRGALDAAATEAAMARIEAESRRMAVLVDDLVLLARLDAQRPLDTRPVDLAAVAADAVADARAIEPDRPVHLVPTGPAIVHGDELRLRQVVDNLLRNVRVHTPPGCSARVIVGPGSGSLPGPGTVTLRVEDDGPGIPPEHLGHVFDRFWRADPARSRTGGAGLGLAIVAAIVAAHGGSVAAVNRAEGGAAFTVELPAGTTGG